MSEFPTEEEEFEFNYGDELELIDDLEDEELDIDDAPPNFHVRRCLSFEEPKVPRSPMPDVAIAGPSWASDVTPCSKQVKRRNEELVGEPLCNDTDDLEHRGSKKSKISDENDESDDLINKILTRRNDRRERSRGTSAAQGVRQDERSGISECVPKWPFVPITTTAGKRFYLKLHALELLDVTTKMSVSGNGNVSFLLNSYGGLWEEAQLELEKKKQREYDAAFERRLQALEEAPDSGCEMISEDEDQPQLWVEKYKPCTYLDLLSDESTNRLLLRWLKLWDKVVFNHERVANSIRKGEHLKTALRKGEQRNAAFKKGIKKFSQQSVLIEELDENGCPKSKAALLCGPPGLGKTTLAHLVAKHAGYNVVEMNASDDRSPEAFRLQLEAATQMRAVMGEQPLPNCLIIDEIDGAPTAAVDVLINYLSGKEIGKKKGKKKTEMKPVHRPIICICNDLYVPALRSLRQIAFVLQFPPTTSNKLAQRLLEVARKQDLKTDMNAMLALAEKTSNDIRSCLSVLQFFKGRRRDVWLSDILRSSVGQKDMQKSLFSVWQDIFHIQKPKRKAISSPTKSKLLPMPDIDNGYLGDSGENLSASRMVYVLNTVQSFGDYDLIAQGVFENYLNMNLKDSRLVAVSEGLEWFCYFDEISTKMNTTQSYNLMPHLPYIFVKWHFLYSSFSWPKIVYPKTRYEVSLRTTQCQQVVAALLRGMVPCVRAFNGTGEALLRDILPLLLDLITPSLRPVTAQLYNKKERDDLLHTVNVMIDYNLTYIQQHSPDGSFDFVLDPNIAEVAVFPGGRERNVLSYSCKQHLAHEIELERIRLTEIQTSKGVHGPPAPAAPAASVATSNPAPLNPVKPVSADTASKSSSPLAEKRLPNHLQKLTARPIIEDRAAKDFFGRIVTRKKDPQSTAIRRDEIVKSSIWFHFKEGFSNAVRRHIHISELL